jgi:hypothetical protein
MNMLAERLSIGPEEAGSRLERPVGTGGVPADRPAANEARDVGAPPADLGAVLPDFTDVMQGVARMLRDVEAMRYVVLSLVPEPDKVLAVRLIQKRYRMSARRARRLLGLPIHAEGTP